MVESENSYYALCHLIIITVNPYYSSENWAHHNYGFRDIIAPLFPRAFSINALNKMVIVEFNLTL